MPVEPDQPKLDVGQTSLGSCSLEVRLLMHPLVENGARGGGCGWGGWMWSKLALIDNRRALCNCTRHETSGRLLGLVPGYVYWCQVMCNGSKSSVLLADYMYSR